MRLQILLFSVLFLAGCSLGVEPVGINSKPTTEKDSASNLGNEQIMKTDPPDEGLVPSPPLPNLGPAPELNNEVWLNTDRPLSLAELRGQVVALEMWTFG